MDDYSEPKDSRKFQWGILDSPLKTNQYSDEDDDDYQYSRPYQPSPGPRVGGGGGGPIWPNTPSPSAPDPNPDPDPDGIYEISPKGSVKKTSRSTPDYDVPPSRRSVTGLSSVGRSKVNSQSPELDEYSRLRSNGAPSPGSSQGADSGEGEDSYNHTASWLAQKTAECHSSSSSSNSTANSPPSPSKPMSLSSNPTEVGDTSRQTNTNGGSSLLGTSPVLRNPTSKYSSSTSTSRDTTKNFTRQRVIFPRKTNSSEGGDQEAGSQSGGRASSGGPALYEEAWDSSHKQRKLEENLRLARSISTCSDTFEDALEFLPEDWAPTPTTKTPANGSGGVPNTNRKSEDAAGVSVGRKGRTTDPVTGGDYEPAWDLNRGLEEKLRCLQLARSASRESGVGGGGGGERGDGNYQEPWDLAQKQRELQERVLKARSGAGAGGNPRSPQHLPHQQQQQQQPQGEGELYETPWDTRRGLAHMLHSPQSVEGHRSAGSISSQVSTRSSQSAFCTPGEPINAMIPLHNQEWYHGNISRDDAERMLRVCKDGSYLVRDSSDRCHYTLSIKSAIQTIHIQIDQCQKADGSGMRYILGKNSKAFATIPSMIDHYTHHPVPIKGADHTALLYPVHCNYSGGEESLA